MTDQPVPLVPVPAPAPPAVRRKPPTERREPFLSETAGVTKHRLSDGG